MRRRATRSCRRAGGRWCTMSSATARTSRESSWRRSGRGSASGCCGPRGRPGRRPKPRDEPDGAVGRQKRQGPHPVLVAAALSLLASAAVAAPRQDAKLADFAQRMFATKSLDQKASACFVRTYDAAHLARHRKQTVTAMKMLVSAEKIADDGQLSYSYELGMNFRDRKGEHLSSFECGHARASGEKRGGVDVRCHGDGCEGGDGVVIALAPDSKRSEERRVG